VIGRLSQIRHRGADHPHGLVRRSPHLVLRFAALSALALMLVGGAVLWYVHRDATARARRAVARDALVVASMVAREHLVGTDLDAPVTDQRRAELDAIFQRSALGSVAESVSLYTTHGQLTYTLSLRPTAADGLPTYVSGPSSRRPTPEEVHRALSGEAVLGVGRLPRGAGSRSGMKVVNALAPIRFTRHAEPRGVLQIEQDHRLTDAGIGAAVRRVGVVLVVGLIVIYAALFPILASASRRLRVQSAENERLALHDALTGLPNRTLFRDRVTQALLAARRGAPPPAVMLMDLDRFKEINDTLGHQAGDRVLQEVARRLSSMLRETDTIARLGGDEFAVLLPGVGSRDAAARVARVAATALEDPIVVQDMALTVEASCGIALSPEHGDDVDALIRCADVAMYEAKGSRRQFAIYSPEGDEGARDRLALAAELRHAAAQGQIELVYQPKACLRTGRVTGAEALVRWRHPRLGLLGPDAFIGIAEQTGAIRRLTLHILDEALRQCRVWQDEGFPLGVAVNLSAHHILDSDLPGDVTRALRRAGVAAGMLELEITESTVMANPLRAREVTQQLRDMGVRLAIDDFGVGHSSLTQLAELPVHVLKIDRSFVTDMTPGSRAGMIARSAVELGRNLGLEVVAEGVETAEAWEELRRLGCDVAQGYFVARPMPPEDLARVMLVRGLQSPETRARTQRFRSRGHFGRAPGEYLATGVGGPGLR
jgi:diguanylate cyclase (GGDEF)-like protein